VKIGRAYRANLEIHLELLIAVWYTGLYRYRRNNDEEYVSLGGPSLCGMRAGLSSVLFRLCNEERREKLFNYIIHFFGHNYFSH
jgi:hypothetical protein